MGDVQTPTNLTDAYRDHERAVFGYFRRMGAQPADAADLAQITFLRAMQGVERFRGESSVRTWIIGIARNVYREWGRSARRLPELSQDLEPAGPTSSESATEVDEVLARLDPAVRDLLVLHHIAGLTSVEIADLLGIAPTATRQRLSRAAAAFRTEWGER